MPLGEGNARSGLQIALQRDCTALIGKLDHKVDAPWRVLRRMDASAGVVDGEPLQDVGRDAGVVLRRAPVVLEDINESLRHDTVRAGVVPAEKP